MSKGCALLTALSQVSDFRKGQGKRHRLSALLALACAAVLCGARSLTAISQWGREHEPHLLVQLGFNHFPGPCVATFHRVFRHLDVAALEQVLTAWLRAQLPVEQGLAFDGKTLRGSRTESGDVVQVLAAFAHAAGVALGQHRISQGDEVQAALELIQSLDVHGWVVTADAGLTHKPIAQAVIDQGGDYTLIVKQNQPTLYDDIGLLFTESAVVADTITTAQTVNLHGDRIEVRRLQASTALTGYCDWPGLQQVFRLERHVRRKTTGAPTDQVVFGISSVAPKRADADGLLAITRGHWGIENRLHWVRDVDFDADRSRVRCGAAPQVMAAIRNLAIGLLRLTGYQCLAAALRHFALHSSEAIQLITQPLHLEEVKMK